MNSNCRVCLTQSKNMYDICNIMDLDEQGNTIPGLTIMEVMEKVMTAKILRNEILPCYICGMCLSLLRISYNFIIHFEQSQKSLTEYLNLSSVYPSTEINSRGTGKSAEDELPAPVEIVFGGNKYNLQELIVVQDESEDECDFKGFLDNLGKEVTATFAKNTPIYNKYPVKELNVIESVEIDEYSVYNHVSTTNYSQNDSILNKVQKEKCVNEDIFVEHSDTRKKGLSNTRIKHRKKNVKSGRKKCKLKQRSNDISNGLDETFTNLFSCNLCKKTFDAKHKQQRHIREVHKRRGPYTCEICGYMTQSRTGLIHHRKTHFEKKCTCEICHKKFLTAYGLKIHMQGHINNRQHLCNICGKSFNYPNALVYHMRTHKGEKNYVCSFCGAKFTMSCGLKRHLRTHTGERPYKCEFCERAFASNGQLKVHEYGHTGYKPYQCKYCLKGFTKTHNLKVHLLSHEGPHRCDVCQKSFVEIEILSMHYRIVHKEYSVEMRYDLQDVCNG